MCQKMIQNVILLVFLLILYLYTKTIIIRKYRQYLEINAYIANN